MVGYALVVTGSQGGGWSERPPQAARLRSGRSRRPCRCATPWRNRSPYKIGTIQCLSGGAAAIGKTALVGVQVAVDRINKNGGILGREVNLIVEDDESKPDVGRRKTEKLLVDDQCRRHCRRRAVQHLPCLHAALRAAKGGQHDQRLPRHHDHRQQVQPLQLPALRLRAGPGRRVRALSRQQARQEMAYRLCRLCLGPVDQGRLCRGDQEGGRHGRRQHRHSAQHRRHDAVPVEDQRRFRRPVHHLLRQGRHQHHQPGL